MKDLQRRREALLLESELNRQALRLEVIRAQVAFDRMRQGMFTGQSLWKWAAPVAAFLLARKFGQTGNVAKGSAVVAIGRALWTAWKERRKAQPEVSKG